MWRMFIPSLHIKGASFILSQGRMPVERYAEKDVAVVQRISQKPNLLAIEIMKKFQMKVVFDLDDNLWAIPKYNQAKPVFEKLRVGIEACAACSDVLTVSTEPLRVAAMKYMKPFRKRRIEVIPNAVDLICSLRRR